MMDYHTQTPYWFFAKIQIHIFSHSQWIEKNQPTNNLIMQWKIILSYQNCEKSIIIGEIAQNLQNTMIKMVLFISLQIQI